MAKKAEDISSNELWALFLQAHDAAIALRENELKEFGISSIEASVLRVIEVIREKTGHQPTPTDISTWLIRQPHSMSSLISRMEARGLISKEKDTQRKNLVRVYLTEYGFSTLRAVDRADSKLDLLAALGPERAPQFALILQSIRDESLKTANRVGCQYPKIK